MSLLSIAAKIATKVTAIKNKVAARIATTRQTLHNVAESFQRVSNVSRETREAVERPTLKQATQKDISLEVPNVSRETISRAKDEINKQSNNEIFKYMLRNAGDPMLSPYDPSEVNAFFALTRSIWNKPEIPLENRLDAIADYFNMPLDQIYDNIISNDDLMEDLEIHMWAELQSPDIVFAPYSVNGSQVRGIVWG